MTNFENIENRIKKCKKNIIIRYQKCQTKKKLLKFLKIFERLGPISPYISMTRYVRENGELWAGLGETEEVG